MVSSYICSYIKVLLTELYIHLYVELYNGMHMKKLYNFRLDPIMIQELDQLPGNRTIKVNDALQAYLRNGGSVNQPDLQDEDDETIYSKAYSDLYQIEVNPLKTQLQLKDQIINMLNSDKDYLKQQNQVLLMVRHPLLARIKLALLKK